MRSQRPDVPRIDQEGSSELGNLVRSARDRGPSNAAMARMTAGLVSTGVLGGGSKPAASASGKFGFWNRFAVYKFGVIALVVLGGATTWQTIHYLPSTPASAPGDDVPAPSTSSAESTPARAAEPASPSVAEIPTIPVESLPSSANPPAVAAPRVVRAAPSASSQAPVRELEFAIVQRAQAALTTDPTRALAIAEEHARTYPAGELVQEREVVAVEALARLGRSSEAKSRANALLRRFPRTPYVPRLERAIGESLTNVAP
ncbi:hypothetical protein AKJ09_01456 [Labilithrix luteola]|uniref:Outer membrane lipoprotein BamD-like domain-containing protein n=1 Tax=Labilithrix luteola TaxID=1391654 RepID=A0A0K1PMQ4_9BACT|nr:hypothetical protein [Labilithrix luteola]AKU94792.1 hypothetical protein AKJ09_01456 [Labilithrix luteola]